MRLTTWCTTCILRLMNDIIVTRIGPANADSRQADSTRPATDERMRTTIFIGPADDAICQAIMDSLGFYGVENRSRAIRYALRFWADHNS